MARVAAAGLVVAGSPILFAGTANAASDGVWDNIAQCESGGKWSTNTGNGYSGGLQFSPHTWRAYGGKGSASGASRAEQIAVAERVLAAQGWGAWPSCSRKVGTRGTSSATKHSSGTRTTATRGTHKRFKSLSSSTLTSKAKSRARSTAKSLGSDDDD